MTVGTKSLLFGAHAFWLHPFFVALAWWKLFAFPRDWRLWVAFFVHDIGYWGCPNMDGPEGELHPMTGAQIMLRVTGDVSWYWFTICHSRFLAKNLRRPISKLCLADKLAFKLTPAWLYWILSSASGELHEYRRLASSGKYADAGIRGQNYFQWRRDTIRVLEAWIEANLAKIDD